MAKIFKCKVGDSVYDVKAEDQGAAKKAAKAVHNKSKVGDAEKVTRGTIKNLRSNLEHNKKVLKNADPESSEYENAMDFIAEYDTKTIPGMKAELKSMMAEVDKIEKDIKKVVGR